MSLFSNANADKRLASPPRRKKCPGAKSFTVPGSASSFPFQGGGPRTHRRRPVASSRLHSRAPGSHRVKAEGGGPTHKRRGGGGASGEDEGVSGVLDGLGGDSGSSESSTGDGCSDGEYRVRGSTGRRRGRPEGHDTYAPASIMLLAVVPDFPLVVPENVCGGP